MPVYECNFKFQDSEGRTTNRQVLFSVADEAAVLTALSGAATAIAGITKCAIPEYSYRRTVAAAIAGAAVSNIDAGSTFVWDTTLPIAPTTKIPDPEDAIKDGQGGIDLTDALVLAYTNLYVTGDAVLNRNSPVTASGVRSATLDR